VTSFGTTVTSLFHVWPALVLAVGLVIAACVSAAPDVYTAGLEGRVILGPVCPATQQGVPCPDRPYVAAITVRSPDGSAVVARTTSEVDGTYRIPLEPGRYLLTARNPDGAQLPSAAPIEVVVPPETFVLVDIPFDSGIR
jgi:hypothetical protein